MLQPSPFCDDAVPDSIADLLTDADTWTDADRARCYENLRVLSHGVVGLRRMPPHVAELRTMYDDLLGSVLDDLTALCKRYEHPMFATDAMRLLDDEALLAIGQEAVRRASVIVADLAA